MPPVSARGRQTLRWARSSNRRNPAHTNNAKIPKGMDKDAFRLQFRESFVKGYTTGFAKA
jgi:hypothetical protein